MSTTTHPSVRKSRTPAAMLPALALVALIVAAEYAARRILAPSLPTLGSSRTNDMLAGGLCYVLLVVLTAPAAARNLGAVRHTLGEIAARARESLPWYGFIAGYVAVSVLQFADQFLWGGVRLPVLRVPPSEIVLVPALGPALTVISLLLVNGVVIPLAEERLWRGLVQPRFIAGVGTVAGVALTAVLFSLKHAIVDASLGRLLALIGLGAVFGWVAERRSWHASAVTHVAVNTVATLFTLVFAPGTFA